MIPIQNRVKYWSLDKYIYVKSTIAKRKTKICIVISDLSGKYEFTNVEFDRNILFNDPVFHLDLEQNLLIHIQQFIQRTSFFPSDICDACRESSKNLFLYNFEKNHWLCKTCLTQNYIIDPFQKEYTI